MLTKAAIAFLRFAAGRGGKNDLQPETIKSILLVELARLGDVISVLPTVPLLRSFFPNAKITLLVDQFYVSMLNGLELGAEARGCTDTPSLGGLWSVVQDIREFRADLACSMSPAKRNAIVTLASRARRKVGYLTYVDTHTPYLSSTSVEGYGVDLKENLSFKMENISERSMKIPRALGIGSTRGTVHLRLKHEWSEKVRLTLFARNILPSHPFVVIHPFSGWEFRSWRAERFCALSNTLLSEGWGSIVFICSKEDEPLLQEMREQFDGNKRVIFFPSTDLSETAVLINEASLFIGNDSGPLHLASALGVGSIGLFGPAWPELTAPVGFRGFTHHKQVECSPCNQRTCVRPENPCINLITTEEVVKSVRGVRAAVVSSATNA